jgi:toxin YoeB
VPARSAGGARLAIFEDQFRADLRYWADHNTRVVPRILQLVEEVLRDPFTGIGKPEPLRHGRPNTWARRISDEHRLVYIVEHDRVLFVQARYHYTR